MGRSLHKMRRLTAAESAWLAAFIDGEGTMGFGCGNNNIVTPHVAVCNTKREMVERAVEIAGRGTIYPKTISHHYRTRYSTSWGGSIAAQLCKAIYRDLIGKKLLASAIIYGDDLNRVPLAKRDTATLLALWKGCKAFNSTDDAKPLERLLRKAGRL